MPLVELNTHPNVKQVKTFGTLGMPLFLVTIAAGAWIRFDASEPAIGLAASAVLLLAATWAFPSLTRALLVAFNVLTFPVAWLGSHIAMALLYYAIVTPIGCAVRLISGPTLSKEKDRTLNSYWIPREPSSPDRYFRQY